MTQSETGTARAQQKSQTDKKIHLYKQQSGKDL